MEWCTSINVGHWYDIVAKCAVEDCHLATHNPDYNKDDPYSEQTFWKPGAGDWVFSYDETGVTLDGTDVGRASAMRDKGETMVNKSSWRMTSVGASFMSGKSIPLLDMFPGKSYDVDWTLGAPESSIVDPITGLFRKATFWANEKGGMTWDLSEHYLTHNIIPCVPIPTALQIEEEWRYMGNYDGHNSHTTLGCLRAMREPPPGVPRGEGVLRIPHTSHRTQGEDVRNFKVFKPLFYCYKKTRLTDKIQHPEKYLNFPPAGTLGPADLMVCKKLAWDQAFTHKECSAGWEEIGFFPKFNRKVFWELVEEEKSRGVVRHRADPISVMRALAERTVEPEVEESEVAVDPTSYGRKKRPRHYADPLKGPVTSDQAWEQRMADEAI